MSIGFLKKLFIGKRKKNHDDWQWALYQEMMGDYYDKISPMLNALLVYSLAMLIMSGAFLYLAFVFSKG